MRIFMTQSGEIFKLEKENDQVKLYWLQEESGEWEEKPIVENSSGFYAVGGVVFSQTNYSFVNHEGLSITIGNDSRDTGAIKSLNGFKQYVIEVDQKEKEHAPLFATLSGSLQQCYDLVHNPEFLKLPYTVLRNLVRRAENDKRGKSQIFFQESPYTLCKIIRNDDGGYEIYGSTDDRNWVLLPSSLLETSVSKTVSYQVKSDAFQSITGVIIDPRDPSQSRVIGSAQHPDWRHGVGQFIFDEATRYCVTEEGQILRVKEVLNQFKQKTNELSVLSGGGVWEPIPLTLLHTFYVTETDLTSYSYTTQSPVIDLFTIRHPGFNGSIEKNGQPVKFWEVSSQEGLNALRTPVKFPNPVAAATTQDEPAQRKEMKTPVKFSKPVSTATQHEPVKLVEKEDPRRSFLQYAKGVSTRLNSRRFWNGRKKAGEINAAVQKLESGEVDDTTTLVNALIQHRHWRKPATQSKTEKELLKKYPEIQLRC